MRDVDVSLTAAPGTRRVALLGLSYVFGIGVADNETFESLLEARLARDAVRSAERIELLNFAVPGYALDGQLALLGLPKVWQFPPRRGSRRCAPATPSRGGRWRPSCSARGTFIRTGLATS